MKYLFMGLVFLLAMDAFSDDAPPVLSSLPACVFIAQHPDKAKLSSVLVQLCK